MWTWLWIQLTRPLTLAGVVFVVVLLRSFFPVPVGMADNGDALRLTCQLGVTPAVTQTPSELFFNHAIFEFNRLPATAAPCTTNYPSSTVWLMQGAKWVSEESGLHVALDLRVIMLGYSLLVGLVTFAFVCLIRSRGLRLFAAVGMLLVLGDSMFVDYMGSPFTETAALWAMPVMAVAGLYLLRARGMPSGITALATFSAAGAFAVAAKVQTTTLLVPLALFLAWVAVRRAPRRPEGWVRAAWAIVVVASIGVLVVPAAWVFNNNPKNFSLINPTETIFVSILGPSHHPVSDLQDMGLPPSFAKYAGQAWSDTHAPQNDPGFAAIRAKMTYGTAGRFLLTHPGRALTIADSAAHDFMEARPDYLGNFQAGDAPNRAQDNRLSVLSSLMKSVYPSAPFMFIVLSALVAFGAITGLRRAARGTLANACGAAALLSLAMALTQFVTAAYGEGIETTKHLITAILPALFSGLLAIVAVAAIEDRSPDVEPLSEPESDATAVTTASLGVARQRRQDLGTW